MAKAVKELKDTLYRERDLKLLRCLSPGMESKVDESRDDFMVCLQDGLNEKKRWR